MTATDDARRRLGFLGIEATVALADRGIVIPDPSSTLVSPGIDIGNGTVLWPSTVLRCLNGGRITIGSACEIGGEGGFTIEADATTIEIGDNCRLLGGGSLSGSNTLGHGAQILGPIRCRDCRLAGGDSHRQPHPDRRAAVLKGCGTARNIALDRGQVIQAFGLFAEAPVHQQSHFHPPAATP